MVLLTNGCSWTWGGSLEPWIFNEEKARFKFSYNHDKRLNLVWPHHLSTILGTIESINLSDGCGSNDRILRTTYDWLSSTNLSKIKETIAVIQWTEPSRYEFYKPAYENNNLENLNARWIKCKIDCVVFPFNIDDSELKKQTEITNNYLSNWTDIQSAYKFLFQVEALTRIFESYEVKYFYWANGNYINSTPRNIKERLLKFNWIDYDSDVSNMWQYERISDNDQHPNIVGHKQIAEIIYNKIKDKL